MQVPPGVSPGGVSVLKNSVLFQTGSGTVQLREKDEWLLRIPGSAYQYIERTGRLPYVRNTPGKQLDDHAGHLAGDRFGGTGGLDNLVSQYWLVNLSSYRKLENDWNKAIQAGKTVDVNVHVEYAGDDLRPSVFYIKYFIDGVEYSRRITNDLWGGMGL